MKNKLLSYFEYHLASLLSALKSDFIKDHLIERGLKAEEIETIIKMLTILGTLSGKKK